MLIVECVIVRKYVKKLSLTWPASNLNTPNLSYVFHLNGVASNYINYQIPGHEMLKKYWLTRITCRKKGFSELYQMSAYWNICAEKNEHISLASLRLSDIVIFNLMTFGCQQGIYNHWCETRNHLLQIDRYVAVRTHVHYNFLIEPHPSYGLINKRFESCSLHVRWIDSVLWDIIINDLLPCLHDCH